MKLVDAEDQNGTVDSTRPFLVGGVGEAGDGVGELSATLEEVLSTERLSLSLWFRAFVWESKLLWTLSSSIIIVSIFNFMLSLVTQMVVGHLGSLELAGASIANVGIQGLAYGIMLGMSSALETLCGQAYGAQRYSALGIICQKSMIIMACTAFLLSFLYWNSGRVLRAIGQADAIAEQGEIFARGLLPQLFAFALNCPMQRFLQAQNVVSPLTRIAVAVFVLHLGLTKMVVDWGGGGLMGAALTLSFSWWLMVVLTGGYILLSPTCEKTWAGFSLKAIKGSWPFFKLTVASAFMLCLEIWYSQGLVLVSGLLPNPEVSLDSISICMNYLNLDMMFMLGLSLAAGVRVSNELGARRPRAAMFSVVVVVSTSIIISFTLSVIIIIFQRQMSYAFTNSPEVSQTVSSMIILLAASVFLNGIQPILSGVAVGCGWQSLVALVNLAAYYLVGLPLGLVLGFKTSLGVVGIWWGMLGGVALQTLTLVTITSNTNWNKEVDQAVERLRRSAEEEGFTDEDGVVSGH